MAEFTIDFDFELELSNEQDSVNAKLINESRKELNDGTLELPSMPDIALEIRAAINNENKSFEEISKLIQCDQGLSAYLMKVSNSALYARPVKAENIKMALSRMGLETAKNLTSSYALKTLFNLREPLVKSLMRCIWERDVYSASLASIIAKRCHFDPDKALMAGLLQDIGSLPVMTKLKQYQEILADKKDSLHFVYSLAPTLTRMILENWEFGDEMLQVADNFENWHYDHDGPADLTDLILVARYHAYLGPGLTDELPEIEEVSAFRRLNLGEISLQSSLEFIESAREEIDSIQSLLM